MPNGRFMVNCGGIYEKSDTTNGIIHPKLVDATWAENTTIKALSEAFPGQVWHLFPQFSQHFELFYYFSYLYSCS